MKLYHGIKHYAVIGRRVDWKPLKGVEIFDSSNATNPILHLTGERSKLVIQRIKEENNRYSLQSYLETVIEVARAAPTSEPA